VISGGIQSVDVMKGGACFSLLNREKVVPSQTCQKYSVQNYREAVWPWVCLDLMTKENDERELREIHARIEKVIDASTHVEISIRLESAIDSDEREKSTDSISDDLRQILKQDSLNQFHVFKDREEVEISASLKSQMFVIPSLVAKDSVISQYGSDDFEWTRCVHVNKSDDARITLGLCSETESTRWRTQEVGGSAVNFVLIANDLCLTVDENGERVVMTQCMEEHQHQVWARHGFSQLQLVETRQFDQNAVCLTTKSFQREESELILRPCSNTIDWNSLGNYRSLSYESPNHTGKHLHVIVPYRNRQIHREIFLRYMQTFLRQQSIGNTFEWSIYIVEQNDTLPFNRGLLFNAAFSIITSDFNRKETQSDGERRKRNYFLFQDIDLLPLSGIDFVKEMEECKGVKGMVSMTLSGSGWRRVNPNLCGASVLFCSEKAYKQVNGHSNEYWSWGYEDTDLYERLKHEGLLIDQHVNRVSLMSGLRYALRSLHSDRGPKSNPFLYQMNALRFQKQVNQATHHSDGLSTVHSLFNSYISHSNPSIHSTITIHIKEDAFPYALANGL